MGKEKQADRKAYKPSSSARAAEVLASNATSPGFGFGGFAGSSAVVANVPGFGFGAASAMAARIATSLPAAAGSGSSEASEYVVPSQVDGEVAQCIRHLAKKDATTKLKALQALKAVVAKREVSDLVTALPPWIYMYRKLIMDPSRTVRSETAAVQRAFLGVVGKAVAPHLRALIGPWWLAQHDPHADAAATTRVAFQASFPTARKQLDALLYCRTELLSYLKEQLTATPAALGDPRRDSPEELGERHERVQAAALLSLASLLEAVAPSNKATAATAGASSTASPSSGQASGTGAIAGADEAEVLSALSEVFSKQGFWKGVLGAKASLPRRAAYNLATAVATAAANRSAASPSNSSSSTNTSGLDASHGLRPSSAPVVHPQATRTLHGVILLEPSGPAYAELCVGVLGAFNEKEPSNHPSMWEAVLTLAKLHPASWAHANLRKAVLPRLYAFLKHGCFGSGPGSYPALLPLVTLLPGGVLGPRPDVALALLDALWAGLGEGGPRAGKAAATAYVEVLTWTLTNSARLCQPLTDAAQPATTASSYQGPSENRHDPGLQVQACAYCISLLRGTLCVHVLPMVTGAGVKPGLSSDGAAALVCELMQQLALSLATKCDIKDASLEQLTSVPQGGHALTSLLHVMANTLRSELAAAMRHSTSVGAAGASSVAAAGGTSSVSLGTWCERTQSLLSSMSISAPALPTSALQLLAAAAASAVVDALSHAPGSVPAEASSLLTSLMRAYSLDSAAVSAATQAADSIGADSVSAAGLPTGNLPSTSPGVNAIDGGQAITGTAGAAGAELQGVAAPGADRSSIKLVTPGSSVIPSSSSAPAPPSVKSVLSVESLAYSYASGPCSGPAAEASAGLLMLTCSSSSSGSGNGDDSSWDTALRAVLGLPEGVPRTSDYTLLPTLRLAHAAQLLKQASSDSPSKGSPSAAAASGASAPASASAWRSPSLDGLAGALLYWLAPSSGTFSNSNSSVGETIAAVRSLLRPDGTMQIAGVSMLGAALQGGLLSDVTAQALCSSINSTLQQAADILQGGEEVQDMEDEDVEALCQDGRVLLSIVQALLSGSTLSMLWLQAPSQLSSIVGVIARLAWGARAQPATPGNPEQHHLYHHARRHGVAGSHPGDEGSEEDEGAGSDADSEASVLTSSGSDSLDEDEVLAAEGVSGQNAGDSHSITDISPAEVCWGLSEPLAEDGQALCEAAAAFWEDGKALSRALNGLSSSAAAQEVLIKQLFGSLNKCRQAALLATCSGSTSSSTATKALALVCASAWAHHSASVLHALPADSAAYRARAVALLLLGPTNTDTDIGSAGSISSSWGCWHACPEGSAHALPGPLIGSETTIHANADDSAQVEEEEDMVSTSGYFSLQEHTAALLYLSQVRFVCSLMDAVGPSLLLRLPQHSTAASQHSAAGSQHRAWLVAELLCSVHACAFSSGQLTTNALSSSAAAGTSLAAGGTSHAAAGAGTGADAGTTLSGAVNNDSPAVSAAADDVIATSVARLCHYIARPQSAEGCALLAETLNLLAEACRDAVPLDGEHAPASTSDPWVSDAWPADLGQLQAAVAPLRGRQAVHQAALLHLLHTAAAHVKPASRAEACASALPSTSSTAAQSSSVGVGIMSALSQAQQPSSLPSVLWHFTHSWLTSACLPGSTAWSGLPLCSTLDALAIVAPLIRRTGAHALEASGLPSMACAWMRESLRRSPVCVTPQRSSLCALELAVACFPTTIGQPAPSSFSASAHSSSADSAAVDSNDTFASTANWTLTEDERPVLAALLKHQAVRFSEQAAVRRMAASALDGAQGAPAGMAASANAASASFVPVNAAERLAQEQVTCLQLAAVAYNWEALGQAEWHAVLQDVQAALAQAVANMHACLQRVSIAACAAAESIAPGRGAGAAPTAALALLKRLSAKGVLAAHPAGLQLHQELPNALQGCMLGASAQAAAQLVAVLMHIRAKVMGSLNQSSSSHGTPDAAHQSAVASAVSAASSVLTAVFAPSAAGAAAMAREYDDAVGNCCQHVLSLAIAESALEASSQAAGPLGSRAIASWRSTHAALWRAVAVSADCALEQGGEVRRAAVVGASIAAGPSLESAGLDAVGCMLSLALSPRPHVLQQLAYRLLLDPLLLPRVSLAGFATATAPAAEPASGVADEDGDLPEFDGLDVGAFLFSCGVRPEHVEALTMAGRSMKQRSYLSAWGLLLAHLLHLLTQTNSASSASAAEVAQAESRVRALRHMLGEVPELVPRLLDHVTASLDLKSNTAMNSSPSSGFKRGAVPQLGRHAVRADASTGSTQDIAYWSLAEVLSSLGAPSGRLAAHATARALYRAVLRALPATARTWFSDVRDRARASALEAYTSAHESPALLAAEMAAVQSSLGSVSAASGGKFSVKACAGGREVVAILEVEDGACLELVVKLPAAAPLRASEVECRRKVGVNDMRLRKWMLSIATVLRHHNSSVADAIALWKANVDKEFEGVEPCLICYSVISSVNQQLPRLVCRTCAVRFHPACLYKWFKSAGKSQCPHCQSPW